MKSEVGHMDARQLVGKVPQRATRVGPRALLPWPRDSVTTPPRAGRKLPELAGCEHRHRLPALAASKPRRVSPCPAASVLVRLASHSGASKRARTLLPPARAPLHCPNRAVATRPRASAAIATTAACPYLRSGERLPGWHLLRPPLALP